MQPINSVRQGVLPANPELSKHSSPDDKAEIKFKSHDVQVYARNDATNLMVAGGKVETSTIDSRREITHFSVSDISDDISSQEDFNQLLDQFLDIPHSDYIPIKESILEKYNNSISGAYKRGGIGDFYKIRALLIKIIIQWQKEEQSKEAKGIIKNKILELQALAIKKKHDLSSCFKNWLLLHTFKSVVKGERLSESDKAKILQAISYPIFPEDSTVESIKIMNLEYVDFISFQLLLFFDALPNFSDYANYAKGFQILRIIKNLAENCLYLMSPVSFTPYDYIRFLSLLNDSLLQIVFDNLHSLNQTGACCQLIALRYLCGDNIEDRMKTLSCPQSYLKPFSDLKFEIGLFFCAMGKIIDEKKTRSDIIKSLNDRIMKGRDAIYKKNMTDNDKSLYGLYSFMQAEIIVVFATRKCNKSRTEFSKAAKIFHDAAQYRPNNFYNSWYYYQKAKLFRPAAQAAQAYSNFWSEKKYRMLAEYWTDISNQMEMLASPAKDKSEGTAGDEYDIDKILKELEAKCDVQPEQETPHILPSNSGDSGYSVSPHRGKRSKVATVSDIPPKSEEDSEADVCSVTHATSTVAKPVIKSSKRSNNIADISMAIPEGFLIKGARGVLKPWEKLLSKNWNHTVKKILKLIDHARINSNIEGERRIYREILNHPLRKTMIGIERIWEEYAWSELHQFDDVFRTCILPSSMRETAKKVVSDIKDGYILPCMACFLGLDQVNSNLSLDEIFRGATRLVESPELSDPDDNGQVRSRLCYLFRTWGHLYGFMALIYAVQSAHFEKLAIKAYDFSSIDPTYAKRKMARLK